MIHLLCRRFPGLTAEDAAQYLAEARLTLGEQVADAEVVAWAMDRAKADGYDEHNVIAEDQEDEEGHRFSWDAQLSDDGQGVRAILARLGVADERGGRSRRLAPRVIRRLVRRLLNRAAPAERAVLSRRFGRLLAGYEPEGFREAAQAGGVALGTAWNIEDRAKRRLQSWAAIEQEVREEQLSWLDPPKPSPPPPPDSAARARGVGRSDPVVGLTERGD
ncbi:MAG: hypothetical protein KatS3mg082_2611 [Nitrospiraceae bacterium]|nr:MAG: hypothetical protein KatS3mg082_2611 [Nitrospiraceae bacterium]